MSGAARRWRVGAGSVVGPHHHAAGMDNQDAYSYAVVDVAASGAPTGGAPPSGAVSSGALPGGTAALVAADLGAAALGVAADAGPAASTAAVVVVADGAGSLALSGLGAALAVRTATDYAVDRLETAGTCWDAAGLRGLVAAAVSAAIVELTTDADADQLGCTLVVAVAAGQAWAAGLVGDSFAVISRFDSSHQLLMAPPAGEYANITRLLTSTEPGLTLFSGDESILAVSVATDGLYQQAVQARSTAHVGFFTPLVRRTAENRLDVSALLSHMGAQDRLDDDTTLVVAARAAPDDRQASR